MLEQDFNIEWVKSVSWTEFKELYEDKPYAFAKHGISMKDAYKRLGGGTKRKKTKKSKEGAE